MIRSLASQVASGTRAFIGGGESNTSSGTMAAVVGGNGCTASGDYSSIGGGQTNTASGTNSVVPGGGSNNASGSYSFANGTRADTRTRFASSALGCGAFNQNGASQSVLMSIGRQTIDATATILTADGNAAVANNQYTVANSSASQFSILVIAGVMDAGNSKSWTITGLVKRGVNAASTVLVGSTVTSNFADAGAASWVIAVTADTTNGGITLTATGQAATTIRWVATVRATEMTY